MELKVLLADDDEDDRMFFEDAISELPIKTHLRSVADGDELLDYLSDPNNVMPNLIFLDLNMPKKGGIECLKEIRSDERFNNLCIAIYSTSASEQDIENTFILGANVYIRKPNDYGQLKKVLSSVLAINWQYQNANLNRENFLLSI